MARIAPHAGRLLSGLVGGFGKQGQRQRLGRPMGTGGWQQRLLLLGELLEQLHSPPLPAQQLVLSKSACPSASASAPRSGPRSGGSRWAWLVSAYAAFSRIQPVSCQT